MATLIALNSMSAITAATHTQTADSENSSSDPERRLSFALSQPMPSSSGVSSSMTADRTELTAPSSETSPDISARNSYDKRMRLLIASGLIAGITPTSRRKRSSQQTLDFALSKQAGGDAE